MAKKGSPKDSTRSPNGTWVKRDRTTGQLYIEGEAVSYGSYRGRPLPPPGRENIIVRTPNPLPTPKNLDSQ